MSNQFFSSIFWLILSQFLKTTESQQDQINHYLLLSINVLV